MYYTIYSRFFEDETQNVKAIQIHPDFNSALIQYLNNVSSSMTKEGIKSFVTEMLNEHGAIEKDVITGGEYRTYWEAPQPEPESEPEEA